MAISNSKPRLCATRNPFSVPLLVCIFFLSLLDTVKSLSINFPTSNPDEKSIGFAGDASLSDGIIQLTRKDEQGNPLQHSVGIAGSVKTFHLHNESEGTLADFTTDFYFVVKSQNEKSFGDGMTFFLAPNDFLIPENSGGGYLGLFSPETALDPSKNKIVAIEFDAHANEWDPDPGSQIPHIGININSIKSEKTVGWLVFFREGGAKAKARISYESKTKTLSVFVTYYGTPYYLNSTLSHVIDLRTVLPERVLIGFSAATGDLVETHEIHSWSFTSTDV